MLEVGALVGPSQLPAPALLRADRVHQKEDTVALTPDHLGDAASRAVGVRGMQLAQMWTVYT